MKFLRILGAIVLCCILLIIVALARGLGNAAYKHFAQKNPPAISTPTASLDKPPEYIFTEPEKVDFSWLGLHWGMTPAEIGKIAPFTPLPTPFHWQFYGRSRYIRGYLSDPVAINGYPYRAFLLFREDSSLRGIILLSIDKNNPNNHHTLLMEKYSKYWNEETHEFILPDTAIDHSFYCDLRNYLDAAQNCTTESVEYRSLDSEPSGL